MKYQSRTSKTHLRTAVAFAVVAATSSSAQADDFSYNYVDGGYARIDDFNGVGIRGSIEFLDNFRAIGAVSYVGDNGVDITSFSLGAGYIHRFNEKTNAIVDLSFSHAEFDASGFSGDSSDVTVEGRLRYELAPNFEVEPSIGYALGDTDELTLGIEGRYWFNQHWSGQIGVAGDTGPADALITIGVRWSPNRR